MRVLYGAVEAGGTKFVCAVGDASGELLAEARFATHTPDSTLQAACEFLRAQSRSLGPLRAIGVGSFGPLHLDRQAANYGRIGNTPKPGWSNADLVGPLRREFACAVGVDTDVNAAVLAEQRWGAGCGLDTVAYVTVGTGIGAGIVAAGLPLHGLMHPEVGHMYPRRHALDGDFEGVCPFHSDCLEGLASGPAIQARCGAELQRLAPTHRMWDIEADYLGQLCAQLVLTVSPQRIVMGGGVMSQARLLDGIRSRMQHWLGAYIERQELLQEVHRYVVAPGLGNRSGVLGALILAIDAARH